jgi:membrane-associated phospholipid phosphatase
VAGTFDWGVQLILWLQRLSPTPDWPFRALTFLGEAEFFLILLPLLYWRLSRRTGACLTLLFLFWSYVKSWAKVLLSLPRAYQFDPRVRQLFPVSGYGFPSGNTQGSVVIWGYLAASNRPQPRLDSRPA